MNKKIIIGNWKCNPLTLNEALKIFSKIKTEAEISKTEAVICPPNIFLKDLIAEKSKIKIGAQDCFYEDKGPFTGEVSAAMLKKIGCQYVIIGHSETRKINQETDKDINKKIIAALKNKLTPIFCYGENREEHIKKLTFQVLKKQIGEGIDNISPADLSKIIFAYEPIWSIGTGNFADPYEINETKQFIINLLSKKAKGSFKIVYGGSVDSNNASKYFSISGMDGLLIGAASLNPNEFLKIIKSV
jgi:triosephosphate isomerase